MEWMIIQYLTIFIYSKTFHAVQISISILKYLLKKFTFLWIPNKFRQFQTDFEMKMTLYLFISLRTYFFQI